MLRVAYTWTGSIHDAQDICQTVLLKLLTSPRRFDEERLERAWVLRVTVNCCKDLRKSAWYRRRAPLEAAGETAVYLPEPGESPVLEAQYRPCRRSIAGLFICAIMKNMPWRRSRC